MFKASGVQEGERVIVLSQHDTALLPVLISYYFPYESQLSVPYPCSSQSWPS